MNDIDRPIGSVVYTQMCNDRGGIECDFTVTRLEEQCYQIVTGTAFGQHDAQWIRSHAASLPEGAGVSVNDVTSQYSCFGIWGPAAREIVAPLVEHSVANEDFAYLTAQQLNFRGIPMLALRVTYVGELGWELYCPTEYGAALWSMLWDAGQAHSMVAGGYRAIDSLRLEKGYRAWSSDITPSDTPLEAGLGFCIDFSKPGDFLGRAALEQQRAEGVTRRLITLTLADPLAVALGSEPVRTAGGEVVGRVTSGGYGVAVDRSIAFAYVPAEVATATPGSEPPEFEVEIFGEPVAATLQVSAHWDPSGERVRA